jgi:PfaD family protein
MANGIASARLVEAGAKAGMLSSYGAAGQRVDQIGEAIDYLESRLGGEPFCCNLIHSPNEPAHEAAVVQLYLKRGVRLVEASAYLDLTLPVVRYRVTGIGRGGDGRVVAPNRIIAKASRVEVANKWFSPPPKRLLDELVSRGDVTAEQAALAGRIPMAQDLTAEADSGGHTDNRPAITLIPTMLALRDRMQAEHGYDAPLRVGAAGGIATPASAAAAFAMGAAYIVTGTINQACVESGSSDGVRKLLAEAQQADVIMAPAADMFEMGVKLQVLKRGTMFAMRAQKLFELYRAYGSIDEIPAAERAAIEKTIFREPLEAIWTKTAEYFGQYDPAQVAKADRDAKHKMALTFRWYLGLSSRWANAGEAGRQIDYQVWCGPAMGAFNEWTAGTFLAEPANRDVATVGLNLLYGAAVVTRGNVLRSQGVALGGTMMRVEPMARNGIEQYVR